jgi:Leucine-rich repeat (LRR) protein
VTPCAYFPARANNTMPLSGTHANLHARTHAQLQKISDGLGECLNLKRLYLGENMISKLPESMALLTRLTILDLR